MYRIPTTLLFYFLCLPFLFSSQTNLDSLIYADKNDPTINFDSTDFRRKSEIANTYLSQGNFKGAEEKFEEIEAHLEEIELKFQAVYYLNMIRYHGMQRNLVDAGIAAQKAIELSEKASNEKTLAQATFNLGTVQMYQNKLDSAIHNFIVARKYFENLDDQKSINSILNNLTVLYNKSGDYDRALEYNLDLIKGAIETGDVKPLADAYSNRAINLHEKSLEDSVLFYQTSALDLYIELEDKNNIARQSSNIGAIYRRRKNFNKAEVNLQKALKIYKNIGQKKPQSQVLLSLGKLRQDQNKVAESIEYFLEGISIADSTNLEMMEALHFGLGSSYEQKKQYELATKHFKISSSLKDSIETLNNVAALYEQELKYKSESLKDSLKNLEIKQNKAEGKLINKNILVGLSLLMIGFLTFGVFLIKKKKEYMEVEMNSAIKEKEDLIFSNQELEEINSNLKSEIRTLSNNSAEEAETLRLQCGKKTHIFRISEITYVTSETNGVRIYKTDGNSIWCDSKLKTIEELQPRSLRRVHRQFILNVQKIEAVSATSIETSFDKNIPIGRAYKERVQAALDNNI